jgi:hypothetical protein
MARRRADTADMDQNEIDKVRVDGTMIKMVKVDETTTETDGKINTVAKSAGLWMTGTDGTTRIERGSGKIEDMTLSDDQIEITILITIESDGGKVQVSVEAVMGAVGRVL